MKRLYMLQRRIDGKWVIASDLLLFKESAIRHWQNRLMDGALGAGPECRLHPVPNPTKGVKEETV
jgi:hypothetical protein